MDAFEQVRWKEKGVFVQNLADIRRCSEDYCSRYKPVCYAGSAENYAALNCGDDFRGLSAAVPVQNHQGRVFSGVLAMWRCLSLSTPRLKE